MTEQEYNDRLTELKRSLRKYCTEAEKLLWENIRKRQINNVKFRRQHQFDRYIVDFYCPQYKFVIELDGNIHNELEVQERDEMKEKYLQSLGLHILRFRNDEIFNNMADVTSKIEHCIKIH